MIIKFNNKKNKKTLSERAELKPTDAFWSFRATQSLIASHLQSVELGPASFGRQAAEIRPIPLLSPTPPILQTSPTGPPIHLQSIAFGLTSIGRQMAEIWMFPIIAHSPKIIKFDVEYDFEPISINFDS